MTNKVDSTDSPPAERDMTMDMQAVETHVTAIHDFARGEEGLLVVAGYGQDPITGGDIPAKVSHHKIGHVEETIASIGRMSRDKHRNIYMCLSVMSPNLV
jgi:hypothetical protein